MNLNTRLVSSNIVLLTFNRGSLILNTTQLTIIFYEANISRMNIRESTDLQHKITDIEQKTFLNLNKIVIVLEKLALNTELTTLTTTNQGFTACIFHIC